MELRYNDKTHLLEESYGRAAMIDVPGPNLYREMFDYHHVPKVSFTHELIPANMPENIWMTDTTFRDGQQSRAPFTARQIVGLFKLLAKLGGSKGLVRQSEFFVYTQNDREALEGCMALGLKFPEITTWIRACEQDFDLIRDLGVRETGILTSCSDYHIFKKMNLTRSEAMEKYLAIVRQALDRGIHPRCHMEDITRADFYGFVVPFAIEIRKLSEESGIPIKIRCCDTLGVAVDYPGASLPRSVQGIIAGLIRHAGIGSEQLEWHGHNDFHKVVANSATAWLYGCSSVNCAVLGLGERTGNCPLEAMAVEYCSLRGTDDGMDLSAITEIADYMRDEVKEYIPPRTPFVGDNFNVTRAGIHADGLMKDEEIYNIFDTTSILNRPPQVQIDAHSGHAGIVHWLNRHKHLTGETVTKSSEIVKLVKQRIDELYQDGRATVLSDSELETLTLLAVEDA